jgi:CheY-like chemotaxis protein
LHNAVKYTDIGGDIELRVSASDEEVTIAVRDTGSGIAPDLLPHVFDSFVQAERTLDRSQGGLGIGLSLVKRLIAMHHGSIHAESAGVGQGSTFTIRLPRIELPRTSATETGRSPCTTRRRILVVDDNSDAADSLAMLLRLEGHEVHAVYSAPVALEAAKAIQPDVILLDIGLPEMDGYELARRIRKDTQSMKLVALTGYGRAEDRERAEAAGFDAHLVKPANLEVLERLLAAE